MSSLYIGLMSGTSLDGVDGVLVDFAPRGAGPLRTLAHAHRQFAPGLAQELMALNTPGANELHRTALAGNELARLYAQVVEALCEASGTPPAHITAIGAHGQTVRHRPHEFDGTGYTVQLNNPALLAELCGIDVIADLRSRDVAAGGQGAPLVPAFHRAVFARARESVAVLNVGGISNLTTLRADGTTLGFDCGPGNVLMDHWCRLHTGQAFDAGGAWAASGRVDGALLAGCLADPYFAAPPPKSTGRDLFNAAWLSARLPPATASAVVDVQATLAELTAAVCADATLRHGAGTGELLVCGGGARNAHLMDRLAARLPGVSVMPTDAFGLPADQVEACAFAWLARAFVARECIELSSVTGAAGPRLLGALYPAN
jgi:anhydro-N-acetylmuramic acid kinase